MASHLPGPAAQSAPTRVRQERDAVQGSVAVRVVAATGVMASLSRHLPTGWQVSAGSLGPADQYDIVLLDRPTAADVLQVRQHSPDAAVLASVAPHTAAAEVISILQAGADACMRSDESVVVAAHLLACRRRRELLPSGNAGPSVER